LRRAAGTLVPTDVLRGGPVVIDVQRRSVQVAERPIDLTPIEFQLLVTLLRNAGRPLSRAQLLDAAQGDSFEGYERTVDAHIKNLRRKIEPDPAHPTMILTVFGVGYKFRDES
jgi:two-component system alkaline phosphatase synthesis response regulator PhoP